MPQDLSAQAVPAASRQARIFDLVERLTPLAGGLANRLLSLLLLGAVLLAWIFVWLVFLNDVSPRWALAGVGLGALPLAVVLRYWWALAGLKELPETAARMLADAGGQVQGGLRDLGAGKLPKLGSLASVKGLWSMGALAGEARELLGSSVQLGSLFNPLALVMGVLSLLFVLLLVPVALLLALIALL